MAKASDYFNPVYFTRFFNDKLKLKKGGGLDVNHQYSVRWGK